jgi:hypothetical protein
LYKTYADATNFNYSAYGSAYIKDSAVVVTDYTYTVTSNAPSTSPVSEGGSVTFTITRSGSGSASSIYVSTTEGATSSTDHQVLDKYAVSFAANETSKTISLAAYSDNLIEGSEYFWLDLYKTYADATNFNYSAYGTAYIKDPGLAALGVALMGVASNAVHP